MATQEANRTKDGDELARFLAQELDLLDQVRYRMMEFHAKICSDGTEEEQPTEPPQMLQQQLKRKTEQIASLEKIIKDQQEEIQRLRAEKATLQEIRRQNLHEGMNGHVEDKDNKTEKKRMENMLTASKIVIKQEREKNQALMAEIESLKKQLADKDQQLEESRAAAARESQAAQDLKVQLQHMRGSMLPPQSPMVSSPSLVSPAPSPSTPTAAPQLSSLRALRQNN